MQLDTHTVPLAVTLRPTSLETYIGQTHLVSEGKPLRQAVEQGRLFSMIFWGPPGVGKTTLARILADATKREFIELSAVSAGKSDIKEVIEKANELIQTGQPAPVLFLDEIHRFNKAQQDFLLPFVETGKISLIGATTENPSFEVIPALLSRTRVFVLQPLSVEELQVLLDRVEAEVPEIELTQDTRDWLVEYAYGDARKLLTLLDSTIQLYGDTSLEHIKLAASSNQLKYDKKGENHYDTISAFIKSMRASNVNAALYYLARMVAAGEDPVFIARRMVIFASEDIGLAQPTALVVANAVFEAVTKIGYPEAQINLAHGAAFLAQAKKDRRAYDAYFSALADVNRYGELPIPLNLRNAPTKLMKDLGYSSGYEMYPDKSKSLLPDKLKNKNYLEEPT